MCDWGKECGQGWVADSRVCLWGAESWGMKVFNWWGARNWLFSPWAEITVPTLHKISHLWIREWRCEVSPQVSHPWHRQCHPAVPKVADELHAVFWSWYGKERGEQGDGIWFWSNKSCQTCCSGRLRCCSVPYSALPWLWQECLCCSPAAGLGSGSPCCLHDSQESWAVKGLLCWLLWVDPGCQATLRGREMLQVFIPCLHIIQESPGHRCGECSLLLEFGTIAWIRDICIKNQKNQAAVGVNLG